MSRAEQASEPEPSGGEPELRATPSSTSSADDERPRRGFAWAYLAESLPQRVFRSKRQAVVFLALLLASSFFFEASPANGIILCPFRLFTGIECAGCGMTRSWCALVDGDWDNAVTYNPFGPLLFALAGFKLVFLGFEVFSKRRLRLPPWEKVRTVVLGSIAAAMMAFGIYRIYAFFAY